MSRSRKRNPILKYAGDTEYKKLFNRNIRRRLDNQISFSDEDELQLPQGKSYKKMNCSWDIADVCDRWTFEEFKEYYKNEELTDEDIYRLWGKYFRSK